MLRHRTFAFGTWVDWSRDTLYIGQRVGHLHNTGFLQALEKERGREKVRRLAVCDDCWDHSRCQHPGKRDKWKKCSPAGVISRLPNLKSLVLVQNSGAWRDGNELGKHEAPYMVRAWMDEDWIWEDEDRWAFEEKKFWEGREEEVVMREPDPWRCGGEKDSLIPHPGSYKPQTDDKKERAFGYNGHCGLALVPFDKVENACWYDANDKVEDEIAWVLGRLEEEFKELKSDATQMLTDHEDFDYKNWKPPRVELALDRKTAPSCMEEDAKGLERDYMTYGEACWARDFPKEYAKRDKRKDWPPGQHASKYEKRFPEFP